MVYAEGPLAEQAVVVAVVVAAGRMLQVVAPLAGLLDAGFVFGAALMAVVWTVCDLIARRSAMGGMRQAAGLRWMWASPKLPLQQQDCSGC